MTREPCEEWIELVSAYADGEATPRESQSVESHLAGCAACADWLEAIQGDREVYAATYGGGTRDAAYVREVVEILPAGREKRAEEHRRGMRVTLVELLVSGAIIAVFGAILFPCFSVVRRKARETQCASNLAQLASALKSYARDHDGHLPLADSWESALYPDYVDTEKLFRCPNDDPESKHSYAMPQSLSGAKISDIPDRAKQPLLYDATDTGEFAKRHGKRGFVSFLDGSVQSFEDPPEGIESSGAIGPTERNYGLAERLHLAYDASVSVETKEVLKSLHAAEQIVREQQGFVLDSVFTETDGRASGQMTFKVPSARLEITLQALSRLGRMIRRQIHGEDRTQAVVSVETKLAGEGKRQERLRERIGKAEREADRAPIESALQKSEQETIAGRGELYGQKSETVLATVSASFEAPTPRLSSWAVVTRTFAKALNWSGRTAGIAGAWAVGLAPVWVPVLLIGLLARYLVRRRAAVA